MLVGRLGQMADSLLRSRRLGEDLDHVAGANGVGLLPTSVGHLRAIRN